MFSSAGRHTTSCQNGTSDSTSQCVLTGQPAEADLTRIRPFPPVHVHQTILQIVCRFCGESAPLEQYNYNYTFSVLSFLPQAHVHQTILQNVCCFLWGVSPTGAMQLSLNLSGLVLPSSSTHSKSCGNGALDTHAN